MADLTANQDATPTVIVDDTTATAVTVTAANALKVDGSAVTQPISGLVTAVIDTFATFSTATNTFQTIGIVSTPVLAANPSRKFVVLTNDSAANIYIALGPTAVVGSGILLVANGGSFEITLMNLYTGEISAISAVAGSRNLTVVEA